MATSTNGNGHLIDEFEETFQQCLGLFTREYNPGNTVNQLNDQDARLDIEKTTMRFMDLARQVEGFFLQKRFLLSALKPELIGREDINELRAELIRKDELIKKSYEKICLWQNLLADMQFWLRSEELENTFNPVPQQPPPPPQQLMSPQQQQIAQHIQSQQQPQIPPPSGPQVSPMGMGAMPPHGLAMPQNGMPGSRGMPAFPVNNTPLAFLEKTTSNIGVADRRS